MTSDNIVRRHKIENAKRHRDETENVIEMRMTSKQMAKIRRVIHELDGPGRDEWGRRWPAIDSLPENWRAQPD
jgi:hypothetical protein